MSSLGFLARWLAPDLALTCSFLLAWLAPDVPGAATAADCRSIMVLQGLSILAAVLVGTYLQTSMVFFPLVLGGCLLWLLASGMTGLSWAWVSFAWYVVQSFIDGLRAHRGHFGLARENADHPHRRYDRLVFLYAGTAVIFPVLWLFCSPGHWAIWGTIYFALSAAVDTVLRDQFDRIPRGVLRWMQKRVRTPESEARIGICLDCVYVQPAIPARKDRLIRCCLSVTDPRFPENPATPLHACDGFRRPAETEEQQ
jgi:hypothetical protein